MESNAFNIRDETRAVAALTVNVAVAYKRAQSNKQSARVRKEKTKYHYLQMIGFFPYRKSKKIYKL